MTALLAKLYDRLTPDERFRAFVSAMARKDDQEVDRLNDTCPRKTYVTDDMAYWQAKIELHRLAMAHRIQVGNLEAALLIALVILLVTEGDDELAEQFEEFRDTLRKILEARTATLEAWTGFCRATLGLESEQVEEAFQLRTGGLVDILLSYPLDTVAGQPKLDHDLVSRRLDWLESYWQSSRDRWGHHVLASIPTR